MIRWELIATATIPGSPGELTLHRHDQDYSIRVDAIELMSSRTHGSEDALGRLACTPIATARRARVLIGGLGFGFTLAAALDVLRADAQVTVAELVPAVVEWNRELVADVAGRPLADARVAVETSDVATLIRAGEATYDAIVLDVDNGPEGLTRPGNERLYDRGGLESIHGALRPRGVLAVWSAGPSPSFGRRLRASGFRYEEHTVRSRTRRGARHTIWVCTRAR